MAVSGRRVLGAASVGLGTLIAVITACGPGNLNDLTAGLRDAGVTTSSTSSGSDGSSCAKTGPPARPDVTNDGGAASELIFAVDDLRIDSNTAVPSALSIPVGIDLDKSCTCSPDKTPTCLPLSGGKTPCDGDGGIDDVTAPLLGTLVNLIPALKPETLKQNIDAGFFSMIFDVIEWNGSPNDPEVLVSVRMSTGINNGADGDGNRIPPSYNGSDVWDIDPVSLAGVIPDGTSCSAGAIACPAGAIDTLGYVANNKLVAQFSSNINIAINLSGSGTLSIPFVGVTLIADITPDTNTGGFKLNGELSGRWPADKILAAAGALGSVANSDTQTLCSTDPNSPTYGLFKSEVCQAADLAVDPKQDGTGTTCGALSETMRFDAVKATLGVVRASTTTGTPCGNHANDSCSKP